jgi:hypothetical protein
VVILWGARALPFCRYLDLSLNTIAGSIPALLSTMKALV